MNFEKPKNVLDEIPAPDFSQELHVGSAQKIKRGDHSSVEDLLLPKLTVVDGIV